MKPLYAYEGDIHNNHANSDENPNFALLAYKFLHNNNLMISVNGGTFYMATSIDSGLNLHQYYLQIHNNNVQIAGANQLKNMNDVNVFTLLADNVPSQESLSLAVGGAGAGTSFFGDIAEVSNTLCFISLVYCHYCGYLLSAYMITYLGTLLQ